jgi:hypothetical protein
MHEKASLTPFEAVREDIRLQLESGLMDQETDNYIMSLWEESYVYIYPRYRDRLGKEFLDISDLGGTTAAATP